MNKTPRCAQVCGGLAACSRQSATLFTGRNCQAVRTMAERALACWGVDLDEKGVLAIGGVSTEDLADQFGTPLHVVNCDRLQTQASEFLRAFKQRYPVDR